MCASPGILSESVEKHEKRLFSRACGASTVRKASDWLNFNHISVEHVLYGFAPMTNILSTYPLTGNVGNYRDVQVDIAEKKPFKTGRYADQYLIKRL
jgi:hypothetical protein